MIENLDQLIRLAQVLRVRTSNLATDLARLPKAPKDAPQCAHDASEQARQIQTALEKIRSHLV